MAMIPNLRIARPVRNLARSTEMYCRGLGLTILGSFRDHDGFDGTVLGDPSSRYHFEFTYCHTHSVAPTPTAEDLVVLYIPEKSEWLASCSNMLVAGFKQVASFNPYWEARGRTYEDPDGYRTVLEQAEWGNQSAV
jgi:catechol 2,3-dioxygenase-like lactoylglutathione lyase family enzyme